jgi:hypothetical protein
MHTHAHTHTNHTRAPPTRAHAQSKSKVVGMGAKDDAVFFADVSAGRPSDYAKAFEGADALVVATSGGH